MRTRGLLSGILLLLALAPGCAVPQPRGEGLYKRVVEPRTNAVYHLYLPVDYIKNNGRHPLYPRIKRWPLVMTFHGMKPYDNAIPQEREWEKQADIYGFIVCAPELRTSDSFMEYPLTHEHDYVLKDRDNVLAIMDHVCEMTLADPGAVLSTSWSCGGYLAHYFPNRFPERFSCIATRLSNFSSKLMTDDTVPRYRDRVPIAVFIGDGDLPACKTESEQAVAWYMARNFRVVRGKMIDEMGHRRIPQTAAAFFAEQIGLTPLNPLEAAKTVSTVRMTEYYPTPELIAQMSPAIGISTTLASARPTPTPPSATNALASRTPARKSPASYNNTTAGRNYPFENAAFDGAGESRKGGSSPPTAAGAARVATESRQPDKPAPATSTPRNGDGKAAARPIPVVSRSPVRRAPIRVKGPAIGSAPYYLSYGVDMPPGVTQGADFLWKDNESWMGDEPSGVKILESPGLHRITVLMITRDNVEYRGVTTVQVLDRSASASLGAEK